MEEDKNNNKYLQHIQDLTYFYVKKRYKKYCKNKNIDFIPASELFKVVKEIFLDENAKYKKYIIENLEEDFGKIDIDEVNKILIDMEDDSDMICKRISEMIDEHQIKKGFYNK